MNIKDKVIAVTGGGSGIGKALSLKLASLKPKGLAVSTSTGRAHRRLPAKLEASPFKRM